MRRERQKQKTYSGRPVTSQYKHVHYRKGTKSSGQKGLWHVRIDRGGKYGTRAYGKYDTEREAAIAADKYLISIGEEPVNILKRATA